MTRTRIKGRLALLGAAGVAVFALIWLSLPGHAPNRHEAADEVLVQVYRALEDDDAAGLRRARRQVRRHVHRDLLGQRLPGILRVVVGLEATTRDCDPNGGSNVARGICRLRRGEYRRAVLAFATVSTQQGGAAYREVAAALLQMHERASLRAAAGGRKRQ